MTTPSPQTPAASDPAAQPQGGAPAAAPAGDPAAAPAAPAAAPAQPAADAGKPATYEFKAPDGVAFSPELVTGLTGYATKHKLSTEAAQELGSFAAEQIKALNAHAEQVRNDWKAAAEKDPEIGGDKLQKSLAAGAEVIAAFGGQDATEFKKYLDTSGLGNHPVLIRIFTRIRAAISDDKFVPGSRAPEQKDARTMYPNSNMAP